MKKYILLLFFAFSFIALQAQSFCSHFAPTERQRVKASTKEDNRTDSFEVENYAIWIDTIDFIAQSIRAKAEIKIKSKINGLQVVRLDLLRLKINSVLVNTTAANYTHNDTLVYINLGTPIAVNDTFTLKIQYSGKPVKDKTWGGFYFTGVYAFNLGVGFDANPHNYGRVWFPCVDNFKSRATYSFFVTTAANNTALCNGILQGVTNNTNGTLTWMWKINNPIPTYLASVAIAPYAVVNDSYKGMAGTTPITLAYGDTIKMKASFANLKGAFAAFEKWYGVHRFERVGFNAVPFDGGAMEHATNIAYPIYAIDGTLNSETLMAHEFAHHWWGNNTTCRTAEDMWLNEGWASYSESLFLEEVYGRKKYNENILATHFEVLRWAHLKDGQPRAISGIPHANTYGMHVYRKGAGVVHSLRGYMGDDSFRRAIIDFQEKKKYSDVSSEDFKTTLKKHTTQNMDAFFDNWVYTQGFPAFSAYIEDVKFLQGKYSCTVKVKQQLRFTQKLYTQVPLLLSFITENGGREDRTITINSADAQVIVELPINPKMVITDYDALLNDAVTENEFWIKNNKAYNYNYALLNLTTQNNTTTDSTLLRIEHHWTAPTPSAIPYANLYASGSRYWRMLGLWEDSLLNATASIQYDGSTPGGFTSGWLDNDLIKNTEDSLVLLYRPNSQTAWALYPYYTKNTGVVTDKRGTITLSKIKKGEFVLAMYDRTLGTTTNTNSIKSKLEIYPNPADGLVRIEFSDVHTKDILTIKDIKGSTIETITLYAGQNFVEIDTLHWKTGIYIVSLANGTTKKLIVE